MSALVVSPEWQLWGQTPTAVGSSTAWTAYFGEPQSIEERVLSHLKLAAGHLAAAERLAAKITEEKS